MTPDDLYIAVDLGAGSGRVFLVGLAPGEVLLDEVRRFHYPPEFRDGHLRWDFRLIMAEIGTGLRSAGERARSLGRNIRSLGIDSWGVDYGLIDGTGRLVEDPVCYRDDRTRDLLPQLFDRVPRERIFGSTGIQFLQFNTLVQLVAHSRKGIPERASRLLLVPDLIAFFLTGRAATEYTNATTTQLIDARRRTWDRDLICEAGLPSRLFTEIIFPGETIATLRPELAREFGLPEIPVIAPATHDTGSAFAGAPLAGGEACISSGTWSLVGVELSDPAIDDRIAEYNFTNEGGPFGTIRFLKNVMGLWILESCRREWIARGLGADYQILLAPSESGPPPLIYPDDPRFFNPPSMLDAIRAQMAETGEPFDSSPPAITRTIIVSLALRYATVIRLIERLTSRQLTAIRVVGGGSRNDALNQATATAIGLPLLAGPAEATVAGNAIIQAIAARRFDSLAEARAHLNATLAPRHYSPPSEPWWNHAAIRYATIEKRFT